MIGSILGNNFIKIHYDLHENRTIGLYLKNIKNKEMFKILNLLTNPLSLF